MKIVKKKPQIHKQNKERERERERENLRGSENLRSEEALRRLRNKTFAIYSERDSETKNLVLCLSLGKKKKKLKTAGF